MLKHWISPLFVCFLLCMAPFGGNAQTPPDRVPVMVIPFTGDDLAISSQLQDVVVQEVENMGTYTSQEFMARDFPEAPELRPDAPPDPEFLGDSRYVLTGEYYVDVDAMRHFQLWLWESPTGALTYTDEMLFENTEEADIYLPPLVAWVFSKIPAVETVAEADAEAEPPAEEGTPVAEVPAEEEETPPVEAAPESAIKTQEGKPAPAGRLYLGLRGGASLNIHMSDTYGSYVAGRSLYPGATAALMLEFRPFRFLSLQTEAIFNYDIFELGRQQTGQTDLTTDRFTGMTLRFPLLIKVPLEFGIFTPSIFAGAYWVMPLGKINATVAGGERAAASMWMRLPIGLIGGIELSFALGPGEIFADLRYVRDLVSTRLVDGDIGISQYFRQEASVSLGYKFLLWKRRNP